MAISLGIYPIFRQTHIFTYIFTLKASESDNIWQLKPKTIKDLEMWGNSWRASRGSILEHLLNLLDCFGVSCKVSCCLSSSFLDSSMFSCPQEISGVPPHFISMLLSHRIHGAGIYIYIYANIWGIIMDGKCYHIYSSTMDPSWVLHTIKAQCCDGSRSKHPRFTWMLTQTARSTFPWDDWDDHLEKDGICSALEYIISNILGILKHRIHVWYIW